MGVPFNKVRCRSHSELEVQDILRCTGLMPRARDPAVHPAWVPCPTCPTHLLPAWVRARIHLSLTAHLSLFSGGNRGSGEGWGRRHPLNLRGGSSGAGRTLGGLMGAPRPRRLSHHRRSLGHPNRRRLTLFPPALPAAEHRTGDPRQIMGRRHQCDLLALLVIPHHTLEEFLYRRTLANRHP